MMLIWQSANLSLKGLRTRIPEQFGAETRFDIADRDHRIRGHKELADYLRKILSNKYLNATFDAFFLTEVSNKKVLQKVLFEE